MDASGLEQAWTASPHSFPLGQTFSRRKGWSQALEATFGHFVLCSEPFLGADARAAGSQKGWEVGQLAGRAWGGWGGRKGTHLNISANLSPAFYALYNIPTFTIFSSLVGILGAKQDRFQYHCFSFLDQLDIATPKLDLWTPHPVLFFQEQEKKWEVVSTRSGLFSPFTGGLMNCSIFITHVYDKLIEIRVAND